MNSRRLVSGSPKDVTLYLWIIYLLKFPPFSLVSWDFWPLERVSVAGGSPRPPFSQGIRDNARMHLRVRNIACTESLVGNCFSGGTRSFYTRERNRVDQSNCEEISIAKYAFFDCCVINIADIILGQRLPGVNRGLRIE